MLKYTPPAGWTSKKLADSTALASKSGRVTVIFTAVPKDASMAVFSEQLAADKERMGREGTKVIMEPKQQTINGLTSFFGSYEARGEGVSPNTPFEFTLLLYKGGNGQSILCTLNVQNPETLSATDKNGYANFMASMKADK